MSHRLTRLAAVLSLIAVIAPLRAWAQPIPPDVTPLTLGHLGALRPLAGSVPPAVARAHLLRRVAPQSHLSISLALRVRDQAELDRFTRALYDPRSPQYHHFLTPQQFAARFAPSASDRGVIGAWLRSRGLHVTGITRNGLMINASGTVGRVERAFATPLARYSVRRCRFFANTRPVQVPSALTSRVAGVLGLNDVLKEQPLGPRPLSRPRDNSFTGYSPSDLVSAYDLSGLRGHVDGSGQTIALVELDDYDQANISQYDSQFGITAPTPQRIAVPQHGKKASLGAGQGEVEMDIEVAQAVAPGAHILVYESPSNGNSAYLINQIVSDNRATIISSSWGLPETDVDATYATLQNQVIEEAAAQGISMLAASGDSGAYDDQSHASSLVVDTPASDPWVTAVGGTSLTFDGTSYQGEQAWGDSSDASGSGGGLSTFYKEPYYQQGPGVQNSYSNGMRQVPDVSADGDPNTGYALYGYDEQNKAADWYVAAGTSACAPFWAAYVALLNAYTGQQIGFLNPLLYALGQKASSFSYTPYHDVTSGTNLYYPATAGWDFATGWGSMDGVAFLNAVLDLQSAGALPALNLPDDFALQAQWEPVGYANLNRRPLKSARVGHKVQMDLWWEIYGADPGQTLAVTYTVKHGGKVVGRYQGSTTLAARGFAGIHHLPRAFTPHRSGAFTFIARLTVGSRTEQTHAVLHVR